MGQKLDILGPAEVAELLGMKPPSIYVMKSRGQLPEPDVQLATGPIWRRATIVRWAEKTGRSVRQ